MGCINRFLYFFTSMFCVFSDGLFKKLPAAAARFFEVA
jgi:hypothetical protein